MNDQAAPTRPVVVVLPAEIDVTNSDEVHQQLVAALSPGVGTVVAGPHVDDLLRLLGRARAHGRS